MNDKPTAGDIENVKSNKIIHVEPLRVNTSTFRNHPEKKWKGLYLYTYMEDPSIVHISGSVDLKGVATHGDVIAWIDNPKYRPKYVSGFDCPHDYGRTRININPDGTIKLCSNSSNKVCHLMLDGISYLSKAAEANSKL